MNISDMLLKVITASPRRERITFYTLLNSLIPGSLFWYIWYCFILKFLLHLNYTDGVLNPAEYNLALDIVPFRVTNYVKNFQVQEVICKVLFSFYCKTKTF